MSTEKIKKVQKLPKKGKYLYQYFFKLVNGEYVCVGKTKYYIFYEDGENYYVKQKAPHQPHYVFPKELIVYDFDNFIMYDDVEKISVLSLDSTIHRRFNTALCPRTE